MGLILVLNLPKTPIADIDFVTDDSPHRVPAAKQQEGNPEVGVVVFSTDRTSTFNDSKSIVRRMLSSAPSTSRFKKSIDSIPCAAHRSCSLRH